MSSFLQRTALFVVVASMAILGGALAFQYIGGLAPCELCILQRWPYVATIVLGLAGFLAAGSNQTGAARAVIALCGVIFLIGAGIAAYHVGVEQKWWQGPTTCTSLSNFNGGLDDLLKRIQNAPVVRCDEIAWSMFGISMAGYNFILSVMLTGICALSLKARKQ